MLRDLAIGLPQARAAVEETHAAQVASLGLTVASAAPGPIPDPMVGDMDWSPRAMAVLGEMSDSADGLALLYALIEEPSGLMTAVLGRLGLDSETVRLAIVRRRNPACSDVASSCTRDRQTISHSGFVPAPVDQVWALVADPLRRPEWDSAVGRVEPAGALAWDMWAAERQPDGQKKRVSAGLRLSRVRQIADERRERVAWETTWPARGQRTGTHVFAVHLVPAIGGTRIQLTYQLPLAHGWRGAVQRLRRPWITVLTRYQLIATTAQISRHFRGS